MSRGLSASSTLLPGGSVGTVSADWAAHHKRIPRGRATPSCSGGTRPRKLAHGWRANAGRRPRPHSKRPSARDRSTRKVWIERGQFYLMRSEPEKAVAAFGEAILLNPNDSLLRTRQILSLVAAGDFDRLRRACFDLLDRFRNTESFYGRQSRPVLRAGPGLGGLP